ncbi:c-type cytochrome [Rhodocyclus tenuis]|uniref:Cytochrome c n=1 Tax=Rhodocyclus tenuis TaxID=1066 RepID=A0A840G382_RHOTE|nr:c-type cytochrome [Rhodocyclus tenuis]MBB4246396.1 cytochrome c [Rhodocyclus tenuis]MBK1681649.1 cytochrome C' [Rhodocyclus tenuis]
MKAIYVSLLVAAGLFSAAGAQAAGAEDLAKTKGCLACHAPDKKVVGPAYGWVAKKYAGDAGAVAKLSDKVMKGGAGVWEKQLGAKIPMPANNVTKDEATTLVKWVLSQKPLDYK